MTGHSLEEALKGGVYAKKQIFSKARLISWTHGSRFRMGVDLARSIGGRRALDFGCGDGTFLAMLMQDSKGITSATGAEIDPNLVSDAALRFGSVDGLSFAHIDDLNRPEQQGAWDLLICTEVLEHVVDWKSTLAKFEWLLAPGGKLLISVPVETGPPVVVKQAARRIAGWRGIGDYPGNSPYTPWELLVSLFAGRGQHISRPQFARPDGSTFHDHKGFNWKVLRDDLQQRFRLLRMQSSPVSGLPPSLASQVWFIAEKR